VIRSAANLAVEGPVRLLISSVLSTSCLLATLTACGNAEKEGAAAAEAEAAAEQKAKEARGLVAAKVATPVEGDRKLSCNQLIDVAQFQAALGEVEPLEVKDASAGDAEASGSCSLLRGGKRLTMDEQEAALKKGGRRMGVVAGEELCNISAYCWTLESEESNKKWCAAKGFREDEGMGSTACLQVVAEGAIDKYAFRFFDKDTKCAFRVRGGPRQADNEAITRCAKAARDLIGPSHIAKGAPDVSAPAPAAGSGDGSAAGSGT